MENFIAHLKEVIPEKDSLKLVKKEAENYYKQHSLDECFATGLELYQSDNLCLQSGKSCVQRLMKNTIWNGYGIQAVRTGFMNISIAEAVKRFAVYMRKRIALVL